jgi:hypothetical protein
MNKIREILEENLRITCNNPPVLLERELIRIEDLGLKIIGIDHAEAEIEKEFQRRYQDAEMPKKIGYKQEIEEQYGIQYSNGFTDGYNQCYNEWLAYYTKKMAEKIDVNKIEKVIKNYFGYAKVAEPVYNISFGCSLAQAIAKEINKC